MNRKNLAYPQWKHVSLFGITIMALTSCVTINIYFPAAAAEKAADKVIDEIWQVPPGQTPPSDQKSVPAATPAAPSVNQESKP